MTFDRIRIGTTFFALGLIGLGIEHLVLAGVISRRCLVRPPDRNRLGRIRLAGASWKESTKRGNRCSRADWLLGAAAPLFWIYFAGVALIAGGLGLFIPRTARLAALLSGIMVFSWFWVVHIPRIGVGVSDQIAVFEALAFSGIAFVLSGLSADRRSSQHYGLAHPREDDAAYECGHRRLRDRPRAAVMHRPAERGTHTLSTT